MELHEFNQAVKDLERFLLNWKEQMVARGYSIVPTNAAPSTYNQVREMLSGEGKTIYVYDGGCENTVFSSPQYNHIFRAYHDMGHYVHEKDFQFKNEITLGHLQSNEVFDALLSVVGLQRASRVRALVVAEIVGQIEYYQIHRHYIDDQRTYIKGYLGVSHE